MKIPTLSLVAALFLAVPASSQVPNTVFLDELTWMEVADKIDAGTTTVIVATAGTEQNGPHMVLGKHKFIVTETAGRIARTLGNVFNSYTWQPQECSGEGIESIRQFYRHVCFRASFSHLAGFGSPFFAGFCLKTDRNSSPMHKTPTFI